MTPTSSLGRPSSEYWAFPRGQGFFFLLFIPVFSFVQLHAPPANCSTTLLCPRAAVARWVGCRSLPHSLKGLVGHWGVQREGCSSLHRAGRSVCFHVSYFGNSWTILVEIVSKPEISAFKGKKNKCLRRSSSVENFSWKSLKFDIFLGKGKQGPTMLHKA